jgi:hypothetical protein
MKTIRLKPYTKFDDLIKDFKNTPKIHTAYSPIAQQRNLFVFVGMLYAPTYKSKPANVIALGDIFNIDEANESVEIYIYDNPVKDQLVKYQNPAQIYKYKFNDLILFRAKSKELLVGTAMGAMYEILQRKTQQGANYWIISGVNPH